jgi:GntR family transcriptional regulator, transcriptional repressor for pyruvate dehydrogenase complex
VPRSSASTTTKSTRRNRRERDSAVEHVAQRLEELVRTGHLGRGSRLPSEPRLAEMLGVSRASLREATTGLVFLGLLKARAGDGTYLQPSLNSMVSRHLQWLLLLDEVKYAELYELREILEPAVAELAARRATPADLEAMLLAISGMKASTGKARIFVQHELDFHNAITRASHNRAIESLMQMMYGALAEGRRRVLPLVTDLPQHCERHQRIFELIASRDATGARRAISADVRYAESLLRQSFESRLDQALPLSRLRNSERVADKNGARNAKKSLPSKPQRSRK